MHCDVLFRSLLTVASAIMPTPTLTSSPRTFEWLALAGWDCLTFEIYQTWHLCTKTSNAHSKSVRAGTTTPSAILPRSKAVIATCRECGTIKKSGIRSCCARGGSWFKKCGDVGDTKFGHTWAEGIHACKSRFYRG